MTHKGAANEPTRSGIASEPISIELNAVRQAATAIEGSANLLPHGAGMAVPACGSDDVSQAVSEFAACWSDFARLLSEGLLTLSGSMRATIADWDGIEARGVDSFRKLLEETQSVGVMRIQ